MNGKTLARYALAQGATLTPDEALSMYKDWKRTHPGDSLIFERAHRLQEPDGPQDDRCSWPHCRAGDYEVRYLAGSTELTAKADAQFCEPHLRDFCRALSIARGSDTDED